MGTVVRGNSFWLQYSRGWFKHPQNATLVGLASACWGLATEVCKSEGHPTYPQISLV